MIPRSVETKIRRLTHEITEIDEFFYQSEKAGDRGLYAGMLERKRDDVVRAAVLQLHCAIEDVLDSWITYRLLGPPPARRGRRTRSQQARAVRKILFGGSSIRFDMKLNLAVALRVIDTKTQKQLQELSELRNRCSHNWLLKVAVRRGRRPAQKKLPLLLYHGRDLHRVDVFKEMAGEYGRLYAKLFAKSP